jgi:molybdopterin-guanine dinucleotide biosynthesis adapter protein
MKIKAVAVVGTKKSGKTTTTENLIRELTKRGYKIATIKHVPEPEFTIDTQGKDTWRHAQAGAKTIVSAAPNEIATIEKTPLETVSLDALIKRCKGNDIVFIEGLKKKVAKKRSIPKIVVAKTMDEAVNALAAYKPILAFSGPYNTENLNFEIPYADALKNPEKLADIVENKLLRD